MCNRCTPVAVRRRIDNAYTSPGGGGVRRIGVVEKKSSPERRSWRKCVSWLWLDRKRTTVNNDEDNEPGNNFN